MKKYSIPLYENCVKTSYTIDFIEGDEKFQTLMKIYNEIPMLINVNIEKDSEEIIN